MPHTSSQNPSPRSPGKMRPRNRPAPHGVVSPPRNNNAARPPSRKSFNCIVDDTALVAGVKRSTRNGIRQWVKNGQIRLFVPLHALDQLRHQTGSSNRHGEDVRETLQWLDEATSKYPDMVTLQGADHTYEKWAEVERFAIPRTLFSEAYLEHEPDLDENYDTLPLEAASKLHISNAEGDRASVSSNMSDASGSYSASSTRSASPESPPTSPVKNATSPATVLASPATSLHQPQSADAAVPQSLQALLNYILWRIHQEVDPVAALESFIFLCNDASKAHFAKGFDIKTKRLEQLRDAVGREDRDYRNRLLVLNRETHDHHTTPTKKQPADVDNDSDEESIPRPSTPTAPAAMLQTSPSNLMDPNTFGGRGPQPFAPVDPPVATPKSPRSPKAQPFRGSPRGAYAAPFSPRGGRGNARANPRGNGRGSRGAGFGAGRGAAAAAASQLPTSVDATSPSGQIDPNSFARPDPRGGFSNGRGGRKLWVPT